MKVTNEQLVKAKTAKSAEELLALAKEAGIELTAEQAKEKFDILHSEGELADEELDNVAGGSSCINGRSYSDDPPYYLITTCGNQCDKIKLIDQDSWSGWSCQNCEYHIGTVPMYCKVRTAEHDPYNDDIGNGFYK